MSTRRALFLDRDGVIVQNVFYHDVQAWEAPRTLADFKFVANAAVALKRLADAGFELIVVSNQPNVALGKSTAEDLDEIDHAMVEELKALGVTFLERCYCWHHPRSQHHDLGGPCACRKPSPYWIHRSAVRHGLELSQCWMIGDRETDSECASRAQVKSIRIVNPLEVETERQATAITAGVDRYAEGLVASLDAAAELILANLARREQQEFTAPTADEPYASARATPAK